MADVVMDMNHPMHFAFKEETFDSEKFDNHGNTWTSNEENKMLARLDQTTLCQYLLACLT